MLPKDFINYKLTGVHACDYSDASGMLLLDVKNKCWSQEMLEICGILIFFAKKGGVSSELMPLFYFSNKVKTEVQYLMITLNRLGYLVVLGRTLFPFFLIEMAMSCSMIPFIRKYKWLSKSLFLFPVISLILYVPQIYRMITLNHPGRIIPLNMFTMGWIVLYMAASILLVLYEYMATSVKFSKKLFRDIIICLFSLSGIYILFFRRIEYVISTKFRINFW